MPRWVLAALLGMLCLVALVHTEETSSVDDSAWPSEAELELDTEVPEDEATPAVEQEETVGQEDQLQMLDDTPEGEDEEDTLSGDDSSEDVDSDDSSEDNSSEDNSSEADDEDAEEDVSESPEEENRDESSPEADDEEAEDDESDNEDDAPESEQADDEESEDAEPEAEDDDDDEDDSAVATRDDGEVSDSQMSWRSWKKFKAGVKKFTSKVKSVAAKVKRATKRSVKKVVGCVRRHGFGGCVKKAVKHVKKHIKKIKGHLKKHIKKGVKAVKKAAHKALGLKHKKKQTNSNYQFAHQAGWHAGKRGRMVLTGAPVSTFRSSWSCAARFGAGKCGLYTLYKGQYDAGVPQKIFNSIVKKKTDKPKYTSHAYCLKDTELKAMATKCATGSTYQQWACFIKAAHFAVEVRAFTPNNLKAKPRKLSHAETIAGRRRLHKWGRHRNLRPFIKAAIRREVPQAVAASIREALPSVIRNAVANAVHNIIPNQIKEAVDTSKSNWGPFKAEGHKGPAEAEDEEDVQEAKYAEYTNDIETSEEQPPPPKIVTPGMAMLRIREMQRRASPVRMSAAERHAKALAEEKEQETELARAEAEGEAEVAAAHAVHKTQLIDREEDDTQEDAQDDDDDDEAESDEARESAQEREDDAEEEADEVAAAPSMLQVVHTCAKRVTVKGSACMDKVASCVSLSRPK